MVDVSKQITLLAWADNNILVTGVKQGEVDGRSLIITLLNTNEPVDLTSTIVTIDMIKPDATESYQAFEIIDAVNGKIKVTLTSQISAVVGDVDCEIRVTQSEGQTTKWGGLKINVASGHGDGAIESQSEFTALQVLIGEAAGLTGRIEEAEDNIANLQNSVGTNTTNINNIIYGTTKVGDANKLDGHDSDYFASQENVDSKVDTSDIIDDLISTDINKPLSANQGKILNEKKVNISDVQDNLTSTDINKPLSANQGRVLNGKIDTLIESNSNTNGYYTKYPDGTLICYGIRTITIASDGAAVIPFPTPFLNNDTVIPTYNLFETGVGRTVHTTLLSCNSTGFIFTVMNASGTIITGQSVKVSYQAIGRWK